MSVHLPLYLRRYASGVHGEYHISLATWAEFLGLPQLADYGDLATGLLTGRCVRLLTGLLTLLVTGLLPFWVPSNILLVSFRCVGEEAWP